MAKKTMKNTRTKKKRPSERSRAAWIDIAAKTTKPKRQPKPIAPPAELWMIWWHPKRGRIGGGWLEGYGDNDCVCFLNRESAEKYLDEHRLDGCKFSVVQVLGGGMIPLYPSLEQKK